MTIRAADGAEFDPTEEGWETIETHHEGRPKIYIAPKDAVFVTEAGHDGERTYRANQDQINRLADKYGKHSNRLRRMALM